MAKADYPSVDDYIAAQPVAVRSALERVRRAIQKALPRASEGIPYQIPAYKLDGSVVLYFAGYPRHYSIYPATERVIGALERELAGLLHGRATIRFPLGSAVPTRLITRIAKLRAAEVAELREAKAAKGKTSKKATPRKKATPKKATPRKKVARQRTK